MICFYRILVSIVATILIVISARTVASPVPAAQWYIGPERILTPGLRPPASDTDNPGRPAIAYDGTNHLLVTFRMINNSNTLLGALLSRQGALLKLFEIAEATPYYQPPAPELAFGGTNYLVTFLSGGVIRAMRVSPEGSLLDGPGGFQVSADDDLASHGAPAVAWDGDRFLVVWQKYGYASAKLQIRGAFVDASGSVAPEFAIGRSNWQANASITFGDDQYLVVWEDNRWAAPPTYDSDLVGARVTKSGIVLDPDGFEICRAPGNQPNPHVTFGGTNFFVVWQDERDAGYLQPQIYGTRVSRGGIVLDGPTAPGGRPISTAFPAEAPRAGYDGSRYFVTWMLNGYLMNEPQAGIYFARFDQDGTLLDGTNAASAGIRVSAADSDCYACRVVYPEVSFDGSWYFVTYLLNRELSGGPLKDIRGRLASRRGVLRLPMIGDDGCLELEFESELGLDFVLEATADFKSWQEIDSQRSTNSLVRFRDCSPLGDTKRFYRVRQDYG